jgi:2,5-furandicarboxylate decarboxylase 1
MRVPYETDEYRVIGALLGEPLKVVPSITWGDELLVPAEAEAVIEGEILPWRLEPEGPFGEWTGYYSGQRQSQVLKVHAVTQRRNPILVSVFAGHRDHVTNLGWEAEILRRVKQAVPCVRAVALSPGSAGMHCYVSIDKLSDGEPKLAALAAASVGFVKAVIVVDSDIDVFNESEVMWALAIRFQADRDADIVRGHLGSMLDPSMDHPRTHTVVLIDATERKDRPYPKRLRVPQEVMDRVCLEDYVPGVEEDPR